jgi:type II secretion system (T2SS) protein M
MALSDKLNELRGRWDRLADRERSLIGGLGILVVIVAVLGVGISIAQGLSDLEEENGAIRQALKDIDANRDTYQRARAKTAQLEVRMGRGGVQLQGFLESAAKEAGVEIAETVERQPVPAGKKYVEKTVDLRLSKVGLDALAKFLRKIETGPNLVITSGLNLRSRDDKHEDLEVDLSVSTYEHAPEQKASHKKEKDKENKG